MKAKINKFIRQEKHQTGQNIMNVRINQVWKEHLSTEFNKQYFQELVEFVRAEYMRYTVYPPGKDIFSAFDLCDFDDTRVVILGQDPYHGAGQAHGLCFSVTKGVKPPPSLANIFKELKNDLGRNIPDHGDLRHWAEQGVLLLNATLTVRAGQAGSHQNRGWETFTDEVIRILSANKDNIVFVLWGAYAQKKEELIDKKRHCLIKSPHPSPFSANRGFFGSKPFSRTNRYLSDHGLKEITW